jgi:hypothetical protein
MSRIRRRPGRQSPPTSSGNDGTGSSPRFVGNGLPRAGRAIGRDGLSSFNGLLLMFSCRYEIRPLDFSFFQAVLYNVSALVNKGSNLIETAHELQASTSRFGSLSNSSAAWICPGCVRHGIGKPILSG